MKLYQMIQTEHINTNKTKEAIKHGKRNKLTWYHRPGL